MTKIIYTDPVFNRELEQAAKRAKVSQSEYIRRAVGEKIAREKKK